MARPTTIHPSAIVEAGAELGAGVRIGPFCHVSAAAKLHDGVELIGHVTIMGDTTLGAGCQVYPQAVLGAPPQNFKHKGGPSTLEVGPHCVIREGVTFHAGTDTSRGRTTVGSNGLFMAYSHVAHDCAIGNHVTMANYAGLGGHADIGDYVILSGYAAVHQFVRVGHHAFLGGCAAVVGDVIPYGMAVGDRARLRGLNIVGLKRSGMSREEMTVLRRAYRQIFAEGSSLADNAAAVSRAFPDSAPVADMVAFIGGRDKRHFTIPARGGSAAEEDDEG
ncbi:acyl-ACP--UDP-N-acetylglucosamine O-acyltransferase [Nitratireductor pacificus]|uniref:Acyl-[acyl-carrier-protein]--UDP-N-acetylglucosamine O-acyltransferase n=1 Tax=Nitratireductor pacificus pht-3B TaxID=391937 RepID=K2MQE4_9HYPH|nr:acyl-ACP--UDP-N-acetylglucosamine O-acyltransferase [Nitratireductor pacificus]EKF19527.1 UDP-N-acetylglucosamine acyltransferase [Nitratireductor pacificus pht-3B]